MALPLSVGAAPVGIQQRISAGGKFDGTAPTTQISCTNGVNKYGAAAVGGLFNFQSHRPVMVTQYHFDFGESVGYELAIVSLDNAGAKIAGDKVLIEAGSARLVKGPEQFGFCLGANQALEITVTTARTVSSPAMIGAVWGLDATAALGQ
jgi:hypothetical protein